MATIVQGGPDLRQQALQGGVQTGVQNYFAARKKKKQEQKFLEAFRSINESPDYDTAVKNMATVDREIIANPQAMELLSQQIDRRFPETEALEVMDPTSRQKKTITHRKGRAPSDAELAKQGLTRAESAGVGTHFIFDEETGDIEITDKVTRDEAKQRAGGKLVMAQEDVGATASLKNAFANMMSARAQSEKAGTEKKPTEFEQTVTATQQRLGLQDRNKAINVVKNRDSTIKEFREFYTKSAGGEIFFTDDIARGHVTNSEQIMEPGLAHMDSPETVKKMMVIDASYNIANDPNIQIEEAKNRAANDFLRLTGMAPQDAILNQVVKQATVQLDEGQIVERPVQDKSGKVLYHIRLAKIGGRVVPLARVNE